MAELSLLEQDILHCLNSLPDGELLSLGLPGVADRSPRIIALSAMGLITIERLCPELPEVGCRITEAGRKALEGDDGQ